MDNKLKEETERVGQKVKSMGLLKIMFFSVMLAATLCSFILHDRIYPADSVFNRGITDSEFLNGLLALVPRILRRRYGDGYTRRRRRSARGAKRRVQ